MESVIQPRNVHQRNLFVVLNGGEHFHRNSHRHPDPACFQRYWKPIALQTRTQASSVACTRQNARIRSGWHPLSGYTDLRLHNPRCNRLQLPLIGRGSRSQLFTPRSRSGIVSSAGYRWTTMTVTSSTSAKARQMAQRSEKNA